MIGVSTRTVHRMMAECGLSIRDTFSDITDHEIDGIVSNIHYKFPMCGIRQMIGHLKAHGFRIQQHRIHESLHQTDLFGTVARRLHTIHRRRYAVASSITLPH